MSHNMFNTLQARSAYNGTIPRRRSQPSGLGVGGGFRATLASKPKSCIQHLSSTSFLAISRALGPYTWLEPKLSSRDLGLDHIVL